MRLSNKNEGEQQLKPNNSDTSNEDQETQQPEESLEFLMLTRDKIDSSILQQGSKHEEQTHSHPDVDCLHVGHLQHPSTGQSAFLESFPGQSNGYPAHFNCLLLFSFILILFSFLKKLSVVCLII